MTTVQAPGTGATQDEHLEALGSYRFGWHDTDTAGASAKRGLTEDVVRDISARKNEPEWMLKRRLRALQLFERIVVELDDRAGFHIDQVIVMLLGRRFIA